MSRPLDFTGISTFYFLFTVKDGSISHFCFLEYNQSVMTKAERNEKLKVKLYEMKAFERELWSNGKRYVAGVDEVGRGPLAGPVVTAAVILPEDFDVLGVDDSKKLSEKRREELYDLIMEKAIAVSIGRREPEVIDEINILEATKAAMLDAINGLSQRPGF